MAPRGSKTTTPRGARASPRQNAFPEARVLGLGCVHLFSPGPGSPEGAAERAAALLRRGRNQTRRKNPQALSQRKRPTSDWQFTRLARVRHVGPSVETSQL